MLKKAGLIVLLSLVLGGCGLVPQRAGVEIMAYPTAKVFIDGKEAGMTPYKNTSLMPKEVEIKLVVRELEWVRKIELENKVTTVIDWEFGKTEEDSGGYVLSMEKTGDNNKAGLMINAIPDKSAVAIDGEIKEYSPIKLDEIGEGDRQITVSFPTYKSIDVFAKAVKGYQLVVEARLAEEINTPNVTNETEPIPTSMATNEKMVTIKQTETGWLRVRKTASNTAEELGKVKPKEKYKLIEESEGWYKIDLGDGRQGWVSAKYAEKSE